MGRPVPTKFQIDLAFDIIRHSHYIEILCAEGCESFALLLQNCEISGGYIFKSSQNLRKKEK